MSVAHDKTPLNSTIVNDEAFPVVDRRGVENSLRVLVPHTFVQLQRLLIRLLRDPMTFFFGLVFPIFFLLVMDIVLGETISTVTGHSALYGSVPMVTVIGAMNGATVGAVAIITERTDGLLARLWVVPVHRASGLLARIGAEMVRVVVNSVFLLGVGVLMGLRFQQGVLATLAWLCIPALFGVAFASLVLTVALYWPTTTLVDGVVLVNSLALFFCTGFVPLDQYPEWIQPVVEHQPLSYAIEAMRGLSLGGQVLEPVTGILLWSGGIVAMCAIPMVIGYRRACRRG
ncbi:peptide ABC transporter permease [Mycolicibacterium litorale]|uniref:Transport permease protein n=1 Tax=Mycolicibacterium litorale TaxID=758802 RepID=A0A6S6P769_9MYCO|nr:ABC transporter permease [Mycolicibacterium litorale]BCI53461.1 peptide ABC transporter permease [Mycolicibacterium litorale]